MKKTSLSLLNFILFSVVLIYGLSAMLSLINQYFDRSAPKIEVSRILTKSTSYQPFKLNKIEVDFAGKKQSFAVLPALYEKFQVGSLIGVVGKQGFLKKPWYQDKEFYYFIGEQRALQGSVYVFIFVALLAVYFFTFKKYLGTPKMWIVIAINILLSFLLFYFI